MVLKTAERIKELREKNNLTQSELARKMGITRSSVNAWEMGISVPSTEKIAELSLLFHTTTDYLLGLSQTEFVSIETYSSDEKELIYRLANYFSNKKG